MMQFTELRPGPAFELPGLRLTKHMKASILEQFAEPINRQFLLIRCHRGTKLLPGRLARDLMSHGRNGGLGCWGHRGQRDGMVCQLDGQSLGLEQRLELLAKIEAQAIGKQDHGAGMRLVQSSDLTSWQGLALESFLKLLRQVPEPGVVDMADRPAECRTDVLG